MSRVLSELLGATEPMFSLMIKDLEHASGNNDVDIRLTTDILGKVRQKTKELGLDPNDTSGKELYHALIKMAETHDRHLVEALGGKDIKNVNDLLPRIAVAPARLGVPLKCWAIKHSVAKRLLAAKPPKNLMKHLGYRSVDSMLKRENVAEIYAALPLIEEEGWLKRFHVSLAKLKPVDFEGRDAEIYVLNSKDWSALSADFIKKRGLNICLSHEMGAVLLLPLPVDDLPGFTIAILPLLLEAINELRLYSAYFKLRQVRRNFGTIVMNAVASGLENAASVAGQEIGWKIVQRHVGKMDSATTQAIFEPHLISEDLNWRRAEEVLFRLEPSLMFWRGLEYVGAKQDTLPISFNLLDVAISFINRLEYGQHSVSHMRESLNNEIFSRYLREPNIENAVLEQLDDELMPSKPAAKKRGEVLV